MDSAYHGIVFVIGNGFDLDLGLKTRYSDFANSIEWFNMYNENIGKSKHYSLLKFLNDKKEENNWFDIEQALLDYASIKTKKVWLHDVKTDKREYHQICRALGYYLKNQIDSIKTDLSEKNCIRLFKQVYSIDGSDKILYTFNYTPIKSIAEHANILHFGTPFHVHGMYNDRTHIMGIDVKSLDDIIPEYSFLIKSNNKSYHAVNIEMDMINAKEVIIYGHSLNMIDAVYFDDYLKDLSVNKDINRRLTIITRNDDSKLIILDNIRRMGISVPKLYSHGHLEFVLTDKIEKGEKTGNSLFEKLLNRV